MGAKRWILAAVVLPMSLLLAGCSITSGISAIAIRDGQVVALLRACNGATIENAVLYGEDVYDRGAASLDYWEFDSSASEDVDLGALPDIVTVAKRNEFLHLQLGASGGDGGVLLFTFAELENLDTGDVLVGGGWPAPDVIAISEDEFAARADRCDP